MTAEPTQHQTCPCGHRPKWHDDSDGCGYHGHGPHACPCDLSSDEVVDALTAAAGAEALRSVADRADAKSFSGHATLPTSLLRSEADRLAVPQPRPQAIDAAHLERQRAWSRQTFGPGRRVGGLLAHIGKELDEIAADPTKVVEWIDVAILALDGAWRTGAEPQQVIDTLIAKQAENEARTWPDWRDLTEDDPIEHVEEACS